MTRVKICGVTTEADLETAVDAGADAVGFVSEVSVDSPRAISIDRVASLVAATPPMVTSVLVTMADVDRTIELVDAAEPDVVQVHGEQTPGDLAYLRSKVNAQVALAIDADAVETATRYEELVDALVVDSVDESGAGGTGETHDWGRTRQAVASLSTPVVLAGGLTPGNVAAAVRAVEPFAVDVSSGVEATGGRKDADAVRSFTENANTARTGADAVEV
ncbi:phosphoribosylanthranilate isomerase [Halovivax limisalsi]|uniref:phosphoribosylanthranilate isomerase n=1 Tax=Halovivax limisalsi TaxID=1453760 RepID=UPI001FFD136F|nr:phosphoribosylanthranilate isomerase [Halovivax limisalsi]